MKKQLLFPLLFAFMTAVSPVFAQTWSIDKVHSGVGFNIGLLGITDMHGSFTTVDLKADAAKPDFSDVKVDLTIDVNSVNTNFDRRDGFLKSPDFFDTAQFGTIAFKSTGITRVKGNNYKLSGDLTMHGVTRLVILDLSYNGTTTNPINKKTVAGFKVTGNIDRTQFGLGPKFPSQMLANLVRLDGNIILNAEN
jgi:polyisoprenoid-binding protein YceI